jgi:hypothetical protein
MPTVSNVVVRCQSCAEILEEFLPPGGTHERRYDFDTCFLIIVECSLRGGPVPGTEILEKDLSFLYGTSGPGWQRIIILWVCYYFLV